jgi:hypothetical protein
MEQAMQNNPKYRKVLFQTNDKKYPFLFLREDGIYKLIKADGTLSGDGFYDRNDVLKHLPETEI